MATWHTLETARNEWADAPFDEDGGNAILTELLAIAQGDVLAFAPDGATPPEPDAVPDGWRRAQLMQAKNIWNADRAGASSDLDDGSFGLTSFPLDWKVRQLIRPKTAVPRFA